MPGSLTKWSPPTKHHVTKFDHIQSDWRPPKNEPPALSPRSFRKLKNGYHISPEDDVIYAALNGDHYDDYADYFLGLGFTLLKHEHDFYYFEPEADDNNSPRLAKIAVFSFILIDHIANKGFQSSRPFLRKVSYSGAPHFTLDSYRARLEQVGILDHGHLREVVNHLKNVGWAKWIAKTNSDFYGRFIGCWKSAWTWHNSRAKALVRRIPSLTKTDTGNESEDESHA